MFCFVLSPYLTSHSFFLIQYFFYATQFSSQFHATKTEMSIIHIQMLLLLFVRYSSTRLYEVWTKYRNLSKKQRVVGFANDLGFSLYVVYQT